MATKRLTKELRDLTSNPPPNISILDTTNLNSWKIQIIGAESTLYAGKKFILFFKFDDGYPLEAPIVTFHGTDIPIHPHIYSNGHICLSILYDAWTPALTISTLCLSILSMLSSCTKLEPPPDNFNYVLMAGKNPKKTLFDFHDDRC